MPLLENGIGFKKEIRLPSFECDCRGEFSLGYILREAQEISNQHTAALGLSHKVLAEAGQVFLLSKASVQVNRLPREGERLTILTVPKEPVRSQFIRTTQFFDDTGELLVLEDTSWLLVDPVSRRILRPSALCIPMEFAPLQEGENAIARARISPCVAVQPVGERPVRYTDIDVNGHLNNARYADILLDTLPGRVMQSSRLTRAMLIYHHEVLPGEVITLAAGQEGERHYLSGRCGETLCFEAEAEFARVDGTRSFL